MSEPGPDKEPPSDKASSPEKHHRSLTMVALAAQFVALMSVSPAMTTAAGLIALFVHCLLHLGQRR